MNKTLVTGGAGFLGSHLCELLQASTSEVYGDPEVHPQRENYWGRVNPIGPMRTKTGFSGPVNPGNPQQFSILELAEHVITLARTKSKIKFKPLPQDDPKQRQPDIGLARKRLAWEPRVALDDGLKETIRYFRRIIAA